MEEVVFSIICAFFGYLFVVKILSLRKKGENNDRKKNNGKAEFSDDHSMPWYIVLGVLETADKDEIKSAYKTKIMAVHPDKLSNLGDDFRKLAEEKSKQINEAYQSIRKYRGF